MPNAYESKVRAFYDGHPINEEEILAKLSERGDDLETLTQDGLKDFDQDHYGGTEVVEVLAAKAGVLSGHHVLDVCSGMGGPARWLAHRLGCKVKGLDLTLSRVEAARRLTECVGLDHLVSFVQGDATNMPLPDAAFDIVLSQEAWLHIPDKLAVIEQCARVVKAGGKIAFTDVTTRGPLEASEIERLEQGMCAFNLQPAQTYVAQLQDCGCELESMDDLSVQWTEVLRERHAMYRSLRNTTVAKFGLEAFEVLDDAYSFFVGRFEAGRLGGVRVVARRI